ASQEAIKEFGQNGGGPYNANSAHPYENPNPFTNLVQLWLILAVPIAFPWMYGVLAKDKRQGYVVLAAMYRQERLVGELRVVADSRPDNEVTARDCCLTPRGASVR